MRLYVSPETFGIPLLEIGELTGKMESSIINSTMLAQIAVLAWVFIGEELSWQRGVGLVFAGLGVLIVQWRHPILSVNQRQESQISR